MRSAAMKQLLRGHLGLRRKVIQGGRRRRFQDCGGDLDQACKAGDNGVATYYP